MAHLLPPSESPSPSFLVEIHGSNLSSASHLPFRSLLSPLYDPRSFGIYLNDRPWPPSAYFRLVRERSSRQSTQLNSNLTEHHQKIPPSASPAAISPSRTIASSIRRIFRASERTIAHATIPCYQPTTRARPCTRPRRSVTDGQRPGRTGRSVVQIPETNKRTTRLEARGRGQPRPGAIQR